jgi:hypothetical protein
MAEHTSAKAKRRGPATSGPEGTSKKHAPRSADASDGGGLTSEIARLKGELAQARERIADLELRQTEITNRIAWVIDSLHNLPD